MTTFDGATVLVTGAGSGIGAEVARQVATAGATVAVTDVTPDAIDAVVGEITAAGGDAYGRVLDVTDAAAVAAAVDEVVVRYGRLDVLVNNAGVAVFGELDTVAATDADRIVDVNLRGVLNGVAAAYPRMIAQGGGHIVNTASTAGLVPVPLQAHYCATKHAVVGLSRTLALEAAAHGIAVTTFCPAFVESGMFDNHTFSGSMAGTDARALLPMRALPTAVAVRRLLRGVQRRRSMVVTPFYARLGWWLDRLSPAAGSRQQRVLLRLLRARLDRVRTRR